MNKWCAKDKGLDDWPLNFTDKSHSILWHSNFVRFRQLSNACSPISVTELGIEMDVNLQFTNEPAAIFVTVNSSFPFLTLEGITKSPAILLFGVSSYCHDWESLTKREYPSVVSQVLAVSSMIVYLMPSYWKSRARSGGVRARAVRRRVSRRFIIMLMCVECEFLPRGLLVGDWWK